MSCSPHHLELLMQGLLLHTDGHKGLPSSRKEVEAVSLPVAPKSYQPVAHDFLIDLITDGWVTAVFSSIISVADRAAMRR